MANTAREGEPTVAETSKLVPKLLPNNIDLLTNSRENSMVLFGKTGSDKVFGYKYLIVGDERKQSAWFKWKFNNTLKYHFIIDDFYYFLDVNNFLQKINIIQSSEDLSIDQDDVNYQVNLDNYTSIRGGVYNSTTKVTTFTDNTDSCEFTWESSITKPDPVVNKLVVTDINTDSTRVGRYAEATITSTGSTFTLPGNWDYNIEKTFASSAINTSNEQIVITNHGLSTGDEVRWVEGDSAATGLTDGATYFIIKASTNNIALASSLSNANAGVAVNITGQGSGNHKIRKKITTLYIGYLYDYQVDFPRIYATSQQGQTVKADVKGSLVLHRMHISFGKIGLYSTTLSRLGKADYTEVYESSISDEYDVSDAPYLEEEIKTIPIYEKNENVDITLKSTHPAPATLHSMIWEGDYTNKFYRRV